MKRHTLAAALLLAAGTAVPGRALAALPDGILPESTAATQTAKTRAKGKNIDIHVSATRDSVQTTYFSLGLLATPQNLKGIGVNVVGTAVQNTMTGIQVSGLLNATGDHAHGLQIGGIANVCGDNMNGIQVGGLMNITGEEMHGIQVGGLVNVDNEKASGIIVSGLINIVGENANGIFTSGLANITAHNSNGVQVSGLMNLTGDRMQGLQLASLINISGSRTRGVQVAAFCNVSDRMNGVQMALANVCPTKFYGVQAGAINYTNKIDGLQLGLYNHCDSVGRGLQIGLVNYSHNPKVYQLGLANLHPYTRYQWMIYGGNTGKFNTAVRFLNPCTYTILGLGTHYAGLDHRFTAGLTYRAGLHQSLSSRLRLSEDLGYVHIENFHYEGNGTPKRQYALQGRVNLECNVTKKFALFASGGYHLLRRYGKGATESHKPICEWGVILF